MELNDSKENFLSFLHVPFIPFFLSFFFFIILKLINNNAKNSPFIAYLMVRRLHQVTINRIKKKLWFSFIYDDEFRAEFLKTFNQFFAFISENNRIHWRLVEFFFSNKMIIASKLEIIDCIAIHTASFYWTVVVDLYYSLILHFHANFKWIQISNYFMIFHRHYILLSAHNSLLIIFHCAK